jgi:hypothetical protein
LRYFIRCLKCKREEEVDESTFKSFIGDYKWITFKRQLSEKKAIGGLIEFERSCPFCKRKGRSEAKIIFIKEKDKISIQAG